MGLFKKNDKNAETENREENDIQALGWDAITKEFERIYPDQTNPKHYGTLIKWSLGGKTLWMASVFMTAEIIGILLLTE